jgi:hypothetical protein
MATPNLAVTYAALILHDDDQEVTVRAPALRQRAAVRGAVALSGGGGGGGWGEKEAALIAVAAAAQADKLAALVKAAGLDKKVDAYWYSMYATLAGKKGMDSMIAGINGC